MKETRQLHLKDARMRRDGERMQWQVCALSAMLMTALPALHVVLVLLADGTTGRTALQLVGGSALGPCRGRFCFLWICIHILGFGRCFDSVRSEASACSGV